MPKIGLVTGAAGFIGSHLCERLLAEGWTVTGIDDLSGGTMDNISHLQSNPCFRFVKADITKPEELDTIVCKNADCIFHHAGKKMAFSLKFPQEDLLTNIYGTLNMLLWAEKNNAKRFIFPSSLVVYGEPKSPPSAENSPLLPTNPYGVSKQACEEYCKLWNRLHGLPVILFRYASVYGPRQALNVGVVNAFIEKIRHDKPIAVFGDGNSTRPFTYVDDVVQANLLAAQTTDTALFGETFNVSSGESASINQLIRIISAKLKKDPTIVFEKERLGEAKHMDADTAKIKKLLKFEPLVSIEEGLARTIDYYEKN